MGKGRKKQSQSTDAVKILSNKKERIDDVAAQYAVKPKRPPTMNIEKHTEKTTELNEEPIIDVSGNRRKMQKKHSGEVSSSGAFTKQKKSHIDCSSSTMEHKNDKTLSDNLELSNFYDSSENRYNESTAERAGQTMSDHPARSVNDNRSHYSKVGNGKSSYYRKQNSNVDTQSGHQSRNYDSYNQHTTALPDYPKEPDYRDNHCRSKRSRERGTDGGRTRSRTGREERKTSGNVRETTGDLFEVSKEYSLAHCVAADMKMGSGIATTFRSTFKRTEELLSQRARPGGLAYLKDINADRYIYYLVTKKFSTGKPRLEDLEKSLQELQVQCINHGVKKLAMPRIGCGLDQLQWSSVKNILEKIFFDTDIQIVVYNFQQNYGKQSNIKCKRGKSKDNGEKMSSKLCKTKEHTKQRKKK